MWMPERERTEEAAIESGLELWLPWEWGREGAARGAEMSGVCANQGLHIAPLSLLLHALSSPRAQGEDTCGHWPLTKVGPRA